MENNITDDDEEEDEGFLLELTSIDYYPEGVGDIHILSKEQWTQEYRSRANFALECVGYSRWDQRENGLGENPNETSV